MNAFSGSHHDIWMLYTFRCAVFYATEQNHEPEKLNWWYWKEKTYNE
ncbi:MAG: helix-hairpin-helix domain-containing protein [Bacteroidota bacterium]|nr:helix-hairpin-helix domain-containing protein [Bacteroidota bacterium]